MGEHEHYWENRCWTEKARADESDAVRLRLAEAAVEDEARIEELEQGLRAMLDSRGSDEALVANWRAIMTALLAEPDTDEPRPLTTRTPAEELADRIELALDYADERPFDRSLPNLNAWPQPNVRREFSEWLAKIVTGEPT